MENKNDDFLSKVSRLAEKAEDYIETEVEKIRESKALEKIESYIDKTGDYVEEKIEDFKNSDIPDKVDDFIEKTEKKTGEAFKKAQVVSDKVSDKIEEVFEKIKDRTSKNPNTENKSDDSNTPIPL